MKQSAGLLLYRKKDKRVEVLIAHPGGPFWAKKDAAAWSIPKGEIEEGEELLEAAKREFAEELGKAAPEGDVIPLGSAKQSSGKIVHAWAQEADFDATNVSSNKMMIEWPPKSGMQQEFPEIDRAAWVTIDKARNKLVKGQVPLLEHLAELLNVELANEQVPETSQQTSLF